MKYKYVNRHNRMLVTCILNNLPGQISSQYRNILKTEIVSLYNADE